MKVFVDTSALYALGSATDDGHPIAAKSLKMLIEKKYEFVTSNYILLECVSLLQKRLGSTIALNFIEKIQYNIVVLWISEGQHRKAWDYWKKVKKRSLSLVDCVSFTLMEEEKIKEAFALDKHFEEAGFKLI